MKTVEEKIAYINAAPYREILRIWRFEPTGSPWVHGEVGQALKERFIHLREVLPAEAQIRASKSVGW